MEKNKEKHKDVSDELETTEVTEVDALEEMTGERDKYKDLYLRQQAEFQNTKKRMERERMDLLKFAHEKIMNDLIRVMDNVDRAVSTMKQDPNQVISGVELIHKSFSELLETEGVKPIDAVGQAFDPNLHHAILTEPGDEDDKVIEELQKGYTYHDKTLRPSMVKVSKQEEQDE